MRSIVRVFALGVIIAAASDASASDGKNYPGSLCVPWMGSFDMGWWSSIMNNSPTSALGVDCPAVKDELSGPLFGWVRVLDRHSTSGVECNLISSHATGAILDAWSSGPDVSVPSNDWQYLDLSAAAGGWSSSDFVSCWVPPADQGASGIHAYHVEE